jgi:hypothetical protein
MPTRRSSGILAAPSLLITLLIAGAGFAQTNQFVGTWQLNVAKSSYQPGPAPKTGVLNVEYKGNLRHSVLETVDAIGQRGRTEYSAPEDGKDYPLRGSPNADTVSLRRTAPGTIERTDKRRNEVVFVTVIRLSPDAKTMTVTQKGVTPAGEMVSNTMTFEKK